MDTQLAPPGSDRRSALRFQRSSDDVWFAGVAGGLGERWGVDGMVVRLGFVVLTYAGGFGLFAYLFAWAMSTEAGVSQPARVRESDDRQAVALGSIVFGVALLLRQANLWFGDAVGVPLLFAAGGAGVIYVGTDVGRHVPFSKLGGGGELGVAPPNPWRIVVGGTLALGGVAFFLVTRQGLTAIGNVFLAVLVTVVGLGVVFGPWVHRLVRQVGDERRDRIRSEERAEVAAHLHDSVLQTLALIQAQAANPRKMVSLARRQERELRAWLYGGGNDPERLEVAIQGVAQDIEEVHDVPVEVVVVGDCALDDRTRSVVGACREAATNAALHSGAATVSIFVECEDHEVTAYVRDRGKGFDPAGVDPARHGIAESIRGRVERQGGSVTITTAPGEGTEVMMRVPKAAS